MNVITQPSRRRQPRNADFFFRYTIYFTSLFFLGAEGDGDGGQLGWFVFIRPSREITFTCPPLFCGLKLWYNLCFYTADCSDKETGNRMRCESL